MRRHAEDQILRVLRQVENGGKVAEVCREHGISDQTYMTSGSGSTRDWGSAR